MSDEHTLALRAADQARADFYALSDDVECLKAQVARLSNRAYFCRTLLLVTGSVWACLAVLMTLLMR